jgi:hypothetical protein
MTSQELEEEGFNLERPCVWLRTTGPEEDLAAVWGGPGPAPGPKGNLRHWLTVDCRWYKVVLHRGQQKIGPAAGLLSVYTAEDGGGMTVHRRKGTLPTVGTPLYAHPGRSMPPIDAVFRFGSAAVQDWLASNQWRPDWGYNNNFKDKKPVKANLTSYQNVCPLYGGLAGEPVHAVLGGWHFPWPDGDWAGLVDRPLLIWTFAESEPWVEVWGAGKGYEVRQRII